jgi:replicative DNA helicase
VSLTIEFEESLIARVLRDKKFFFTVQSLLDENYFESLIARDLLHVANAFHTKYSSDRLTIDIVKNEIMKKLSLSKKRLTDPAFKEQLSMYNEIIDRIYAMDISDGQAYSESVVVDFARRRAFTAFFIKSVEKINRGADISSLSAEVSKIDSIGTQLSLGYDYFAEVVPRTSSSYEKPEHMVSTGFKRLNRYLGGGLSGGELGLIVGPPSRGKTAVLVNLAVGALLSRKNVIYFVLEGPHTDIAVRVDMRLARVDKDELIKKSKEVHDFVTYFSEKVAKSKLILQTFPGETATVQDLANFVVHKKMVDGFEADLIIIDYLNLCKRSTKEDIWVGRNYREGKSWAVSINKPVWSAVQAKMGALKSNIVTPHDIAEATGRIWADADVILGLCQSEVDESKTPPEMRFYLGKNRNRPAKKIIPLTFNKDVMLVEERQQ